MAFLGGLTLPGGFFGGRFSTVYTSGVVPNCLMISLIECSSPMPELYSMPSTWIADQQAAYTARTARDQERREDLFR